MTRLATEREIHAAVAPLAICKDGNRQLLVPTSKFDAPFWSEKKKERFRVL